MVFHVQLRGTFALLDSQYARAIFRGRDLNEMITLMGVSRKERKVLSKGQKNE
jgi:hypothetical protein